MATRGIDNRALADAAGVDEGTVGEFLRLPDRWLALRTQSRIEDALELRRGALMAAAQDTERKDTPSPTVEPIAMSGTGVTFPQVDVEIVDGAPGYAGFHTVTIKAAAIGVEVSTAYDNADDRARFITDALAALREMGDKGGTPGIHGPR